MSFRLTPTRLAAIYSCLRAMPPFCRWKLPPADQITFKAVKRHDVYGEHDMTPNIIRVSTSLNGHWDTICKTLAHEMVHEAQRVAGEPRTHGEGGFMRRWRLVARRFGWDPKAT